MGKIAEHTTGILSFATIGVIFQHFSAKSMYICRGFSTLSMPQAALMGGGIYVISQVVFAIFKSSGFLKKQITPRESEMIITVLTGIIGTAMISGFTLPAVITGAAMSSVACVIESYFKKKKN